MSYLAEDFLKVIPGTGGIIKNIAERVGCTRQTVYAALERWSTVKAAFAEEKENFKDAAEERLYEKIMEGVPDMIKYFLSTQARDRGYGQSSGAQIPLTPDDLRGMTDAELDELDRALSEGRTPRLR